MSLSNSLFGRCDSGVLLGFISSTQHGMRDMVVVGNRAAHLVVATTLTSSLCCGLKCCFNRAGCDIECVCVCMCLCVCPCVCVCLSYACMWLPSSAVEKIREAQRIRQKGKGKAKAVEMEEN